ncbi:TSUP family transporter [Parafrankia sp. FMc2]|uniref:TSUP family transporter n=1 Tax=Parafrankia sp. FMc2 TaxID=3233196 RepID=UPI0034D7283F
MMIVLLAFVAGFLIAAVTAPVGVSGAVFMLPVQLDVLHTPNPAVTPTNLLFNVVATPGALLRYRARGQGAGPLARRLVAGTLPGVVLGAVLRVHVVPGARLFRLLLGLFLLPLGLWLLLSTARARRQAAMAVRGSDGRCGTTCGSPGENAGGSGKGTTGTAGRKGAAPGPAPRTITALALAVGLVGGVYGIGGGSLLSPILVGRGLPVATVAPAALTATFTTSVVGAVTYALLAMTAPGSIAPHWAVGLAGGLGGLAGASLGAHLQHRVPDTALRLLLGGLAVALSIVHLLQAT